MKLKKVHLPHPHPNGGFSNPSLGGGPVLPLSLAAQRVELSEVSTLFGTAATDVPSGIVLLLASAEKGIHKLSSLYSELAKNMYVPW